MPVLSAVALLGVLACDEQEDLRAERLAEQRQQLARQLSRQEEYGQVAENLAAVDRLLAGAGRAKWVPCRQGWLNSRSLLAWKVWNTPKEGRPVPYGRDHSLAGHPFRVVVDLSEQLHEHGIDFLFVVIPSPFQVRQGLLREEAAREDFPGLSSELTRFLLALNGSGVEVLDLTGPFVEQVLAGHAVMREENTHWAPRGAEVAGRLVGEYLQRLPQLKASPLVEGEGFLLHAATATADKDKAGAPSDEAVELDYHAVHALDGYPIRVANRRSPVVVLGDSFVEYYKAKGCDFARQLHRFSGKPLDLIAIPGGGVKTCRDALRRRRDDLEGKQVVVWLLWARSLHSERWKKVPLFRAR